MASRDVDKSLEDTRQVILESFTILSNAESILETAKDQYEDEPRHMTNSRLLARFLSRYRWYFPLRAIDESSPSLDDAWAHYEHFTLARCFTDGREPFVRAPAGEQERATELYPLWRTPVKELMDFGVSVRMYFSTLLLLSSFMALAGVMNIPLMTYFWNYGEKNGVHWFVRASAICDETEWVACDNCNGEYAPEYPEYRLDGQNVARNACNFDDWLVQGLWSFAASILLLVLFGFAFFMVQRKAEIVFDEEVQTASDYSVKITNPPPDATDPEEWRSFLNSCAGDDSKGVTSVTIALDNAKLVGALIKRRKLLQKLSRKLPLSTDMTDDASVATAVYEAGDPRWLSVPFMPDAHELYASIKRLEEEIKVYLQQDYQAVAVFAIFETERGQRNALHTLSTGKFNVWRNKFSLSRFRRNKLTVYESAKSSSMWDLADVLSEESVKTHVIQFRGSSMKNILMFRGKHVLNVKEASEPNDIRWKDLETSPRVRRFGFVGSTIGMMAFVAWSGYFVSRLMKRYPGSQYATIFITVTNAIVPAVCDFVNDFETHSSEGKKQVSLFAKIALFRWFNSGIVLSIVSSFIETISIEDGNESQRQSLAYMVYPVMFSEMVFTPLIYLMDLPENFRKHFLAPRARDQQEMNSYFSGTRFELAERYTDATKIMFVALFFSSILPESFFIASVALLIQFFVGKFCLLRLWSPTPDIGFRLARLSRNYFFSASLVAHIVMSAYWWSGFPYDNVCEENGEYTYCNQNFFAARVFPPLPRFQPDGIEWMASSQETITSLYAWTSVIVIVAALSALLQNIAFPRLKALFVATYEPDGADQGIDFSSVEHLQEVHGYIPQSREAAFAYPLLSCELGGVSEDLIGWKDPVHGYEAHNLVNDAYSIVGGQPLHPVFSIVKQWKPGSVSEQKTAQGLS